ncbi:MBOAT family O-acyltransferase [Planctomycetota bacterium]
MLFQTWIFLPFFLITYAVYLALRKTRFNNLWILIVSYIFYGWWNPLFLILIAYSTIIDYILIALMVKSPRPKLWLSLSIINSLILLGFFKYGGFVTENLNVLLLSLDSPYVIEMPGLLFPVGISFYLFKSIGYVVDCYRSEVEREKNFVRHAVFVSFFPILVMGPIERAKNLFGQLRDTPPITIKDVSDGLSLFVVGLFKKVALADFLALYVDEVYAMPGEYQAPALMLATFAFTWQIYFDFSGYTDMARGLARMMGFRIMLNFNHPYLADGLSDFWRRWHISLSTWFRDYLYIPLGGNRKGNFATYRNLFLTMLLSGLWHAGLGYGATLTFVVWGVVHGLGLMLTRNLERNLFYREKTPKIIKQIAVFIFVAFAWIFFRASSLDEAGLIITGIFSAGWVDPQFPLLMAILILAVWFYQFAVESRVRRYVTLAPVRIGVVVFMILYMTVFASSGVQNFIYMQF